MSTGLIASTVATPPPPALRGLAAALGGLAGALVVAAAAAVIGLGWTWSDALDAFVVTNAVIGASFAACGAVLAWHRSGNPIGWLFAIGGVAQAVSAAAAPLEVLAAGEPDAPLRRLLATLFVYSWPWAIGVCIPVALLLFPDGRPAGPRWRPVVAAAGTVGVLFVVQMGSFPAPADDAGAQAYLTLPFYGRLQPLWTAVGVGISLTYGAAVVSLALRYRRGTETIRRQLLWLLFAVSVVVVVFVLWGSVAGTPVAVLLGVPLIPLAVTVAMVRHRLLDIRLVVSRALAWLVLSCAVVVAYAGLVALLDRVVTDRVGRSALVTVALVLLAAPVLPRLQRLVDRAVYGDRDPARVVSRLGSGLTGAGLVSVTATVRQALRLPYAALRYGADDEVADGDPPEREMDLPLRYDGRVVGTLTVGLRPGERRLADADRRVLDLLAAPLAVAVHATATSAALQATRERLVGAREEERRRLRRELHDGLGPALTGIAFTADAAANLITDRDRCAALLDRLRRDSRVALADVRRVTEELRPPALDELGLAEALRQRAEQLTGGSAGSPLRITLDVPSADLVELPAAVEVASYRIAVEALTNVARHARASRATVRMSRAGSTGPAGGNPALEVLVTDDGTGRGGWVPGVGLTAMRERVDELGGTLVTDFSPVGGRVRARLPLASR